MQNEENNDLAFHPEHGLIQLDELAEIDPKAAEFKAKVGDALKSYYTRNKAQITHPALCSFCGGSISRRIKSPKRRATINLPCGHVEGSRPRQAMSTKEDMF